MSAQPPRVPRISPPPPADPNDGPIPKAPSSIAASVHAHRDTPGSAVAVAPAPAGPYPDDCLRADLGPPSKHSAPAATTISLQRRETQHDITVPVPPKIPIITQVANPPPPPPPRSGAAAPAAPRPADDLRNATKPPPSPPAKSHPRVGLLTLPRPPPPPGQTAG
ncbi:hypothetical protein QBC46DRAFT_345350 [Diplogelasinospora grovesii]|uniref:Uncharacterized protein n=1 Tax=Diplogelasinospora grovesii TaxID=303347 RepID=A0AAN6N1L9_9PEZI|nr:hypothetical protein QBC46DRAFT_345350 [Diplogelasinospora grovesii]